MKSNNNDIINSMLKIYKNTNDMIILGAEFSKKRYDFYISQVMEIQKELKTIPKIFKKRRASLEKELKKMQDLADKNFNNYLLEIQDIYDLQIDLTKKMEVKDNDNKKNKSQTK